MIGEYNRSLKCKDCIHSKADFISRVFNFSAGFRCTIPEAVKSETYDPVTGKITPGYLSFCSTMRIEKACGPQAKAWSPRSKKHLFLLFQKESV